MPKIKIRNDYNLPQELVNLVEANAYDRGESQASATDLLKPSRMFALEQRHKNDLEIDVSEALRGEYGTAWHEKIERYVSSDSIVEKRLYAVIGDWVLSGKPDLLQFNNKTLVDWKTAGVSSYLNKEKEEFRDWEIQLNIYKFLWEENHPEHPVEHMKVVVFLVDFAPSRRESSLDYPHVPVLEVIPTMWSHEQIREWISSQIDKHQAAIKTLPLCTNEERWHRGDKWATIKPGGSRATRVFASEFEASDFAQKKGLDIQHRPGVSLRCRYWCPVSQFCDQYKLQEENHNA
jgi:hypothetical protein